MVNGELNYKYLMFTNQDRLRYWYDKIYEHINNLDMVRGTNRYRSIEWGSEFWIFEVNSIQDMYPFKKMFISIDEQLENNFIGTFTDILEGNVEEVI